VLLLLAACSGSNDSLPVATQTLIPIVVTDTPVPILPTATLSNLPVPDDVFVTDIPTESPLLIPALAQPLLAQVLLDLSQQLEIPTDNIQLIRFETATWMTVDLGCGEAGAVGADNLTIEGFRIVVEAEGDVYEYHTDSQSNIRQCADAGVVAGDTTTLLDVDPIAAELTFIAQRRLAESLDLPTRRIRLVDIVPVTWRDSSLGCPLPGQTYTPVEVDGYRIVLAVGDDEYIYHTDPERIFLCDPENEQAS